MTQTIKHMLATSIIVTLTVLASVEAVAEERPATPNTGAYVSAVDNDWVELSIVPNVGEPLFPREAREIVDRLFANQSHGSELADLAHYTCALYKREGVYLSYEFVTTIRTTRQQHTVLLVDRIRFLFACAIPAGM